MVGAVRLEDCCADVKCRTQGRGHTLAAAAAASQAGLIRFSNIQRRHEVGLTANERPSPTRACPNSRSHSTATSAR